MDKFMFKNTGCTFAWFLITGFILLFISCASSPSVHQTAGGLEVAYHEIPGFFTNPPDVEGVLFGLGAGASMDEAMVQARDDISSQLKTQVNIVTESTASSSTENGESAFKTSFDQSSVHISETVLEKTKRIDYKISAGGTFFVLVYYPLYETLANSETQIVAEIRREKEANLRRTTIASSVVPGTGQLMNRDKVTGGWMLTGAIALLGSSVTSFILGSQDYQKAQTAANDTELAAFNQRAQTEYFIGYVTAGLYLAEAVFSAIQNYNAQK